MTVGESRVKIYAPFRQTLKFLNKAIGRPIVLAGGCIRDVWVQGPDLIKDYDAWVLGVEESQFPALDNHLASALHPYVCNAQHSPDDTCVNYPTKTFHAAKCNLHFPWIPDNKTTQLIYTPATTMEELLAKFDWRACSFGYDGETVISTGATDFATRTLTLNPDNALRSARNTLRRGFYFEDKFRGTAHPLKLPNETILALAAMLILSAEEREA